MSSTQREEHRDIKQISASPPACDKLMAFTHSGIFRVFPLFPRQLQHQRWTRLAPVGMSQIRQNGNTTGENPVLRHSSLAKVEDILMHKFHDRSLLAQALTHRSVVRSSSQNPAYYEDQDEELHVISHNNERLELLGDRVFGLLATNILFGDNAEKSEGQLTHTLHSILSRRTADKYFRSLGLHNYMLEADSLKGGLGSRYGDCFEALLAALFLDGGFESADSFFRTRLVPTCDIFAGRYTDTNYKKKLQEYLVSQGLPSPALATQVKYHPESYDSDTGLFVQAIHLFGRKVASGRDFTRIEADQQAAKRLLTNLQNSKATCFLLRLARRANDEKALEKLKNVRAAQVMRDLNEVPCSS